MRGAQQALARGGQTELLQPDLKIEVDARLTGDEAAVREGIRLLRRGIEHHPDEWRNRFYLGFNYFFYLGENAAAAEALEHASKLPGSPRYLPRLVARLRSESADEEAAESIQAELNAHFHSSLAQCIPLNHLRYFREFHQGIPECCLNHL